MEVLAPEQTLSTPTAADYFPTSYRPGSGMPGAPFVMSTSSSAPPPPTISQNVPGAYIHAIHVGNTPLTTPTQDFSKEIMAVDRDHYFQILEDHKDILSTEEGIKKVAQSLLTKFDSITTKTPPLSYEEKIKRMPAIVEVLFSQSKIERQRFEQLREEVFNGLLTRAVGTDSRTVTSFLWNFINTTGLASGISFMAMPVLLLLCSGMEKFSTFSGMTTLATSTAQSVLDYMTSNASAPTSTSTTSQPSPPPTTTTTSSNATPTTPQPSALPTPSSATAPVSPQDLGHILYEIFGKVSIKNMLMAFGIREEAYESLIKAIGAARNQVSGTVTTMTEAVSPYLEPIMTKVGDTLKSIFGDFLPIYGYTFGIAAMGAVIYQAFQAFRGPSEKKKEIFYDLTTRCVENAMSLNRTNIEELGQGLVNVAGALNIPALPVAEQILKAQGIKDKEQELKKLIPNRTYMQTIKRIASSIAGYGLRTF